MVPRLWIGEAQPKLSIRLCASYPQASLNSDQRMRIGPPRARRRWPTTPTEGRRPAVGRRARLADPKSALARLAHSVLVQKKRSISCAILFHAPSCLQLSPNLCGNEFSPKKSLSPSMFCRIIKIRKGIAKAINPILGGSPP